jgi:hypothetical protein
MPLMILGLVLNSLVTLSLFFNDDIGPVFAGVMLVFWAISMLGLILILAGEKGIGAILVFVGSIAYVPLGLIAVAGAKKVLVASKQPAENPA